MIKTLKKRILKFIYTKLVKYHYYEGIHFQGEIRRQYWQDKIKKIGKNTKIYGDITVLRPQNIEIGDFCTLNQGVILGGRGGLVIGNNVRISPGVIIMTGGLDFENPPPYKHYEKKVVIEDNVWIATGAIILPGVKLAKNTIVAAGAVVNKSTEPYSIIGGIPAKLIKKYKNED